MKSIKRYSRELPYSVPSPSYSEYLNFDEDEDDNNDIVQPGETVQDDIHNTCPPSNTSIVTVPSNDHPVASQFWGLGLENIRFSAATTPSHFAASSPSPQYLLAQHMSNTVVITVSQPTHNNEIISIVNGCASFMSDTTTGSDMTGLGSHISNTASGLVTSNGHSLTGTSVSPGPLSLSSTTEGKTIPGHSEETSAFPATLEDRRVARNAFVTVWLRLSSATDDKQKRWPCPVTGPGPDTNDSCGQVLSSKNALKIHLERHYGRLLIQCDWPGCDKLLQENSLGKHKREIHEEVKRLCYCTGTAIAYNRRYQMPRDCQCTGRKDWRTIKKSERVLKATAVTQRDKDREKAQKKLAQQNKGKKNPDGISHTKRAESDAEIMRAKQAAKEAAKTGASSK